MKAERKAKSGLTGCVVKWETVTRMNLYATQPMRCGMVNSTKTKLSDLVRPISDAVKEAHNAAVDADWNGNESTHLWHHYNRLRERELSGELYEVMF